MGTRESDKGAHEDCIATWAMSCQEMSQKSRLTVSACLSSGEGVGDTEDEMAGWHHPLDGHEFE